MELVGCPTSDIRQIRILLMTESALKLEPIQVSQALPEQAFEYLRAIIVEGGYLPGHKLPIEPELARSLNISRSTLREALNRLEVEGFIARKRGVGTFVIGPTPFHVDAGIEKLHSDTEIITSRGHRVGTAEIHIAAALADSEVAAKLRLAEGEPVTIVDRLRTADDTPFCWDSNIFPAKYLPASTKPETLGLSLFKYTTEKLGLHIGHAVTYLVPVLCDELLSQKLKVPVGSPMLQWVQVHHTRENDAVWLSRIWYPEHVASWHVVRTR